MIRRIALVCLMLAGVPQGARANGRPAGTSTITFRPGHETDIAAGLTFGLVFSHDGGKTWSWTCEDAVGYGGMYDPHYVYSPSGALFATTFTGLKVERDSCTYGLVPASPAFVSAATQGPAPDHALYYAAVQPADATHVVDFAIYKSTDDGLTFPTKSAPTATVNWWQSIAVAPSNAQRLYLTGYAYVPGTGTGMVKQQLMFRSDNGGTSWVPLLVTDFVVAPNSDIEIVGIASDDPDHVYARVKLDDNMQSDSIYVSVNKGAKWTKIRSKPVAIGAFVVRAALNAGGKHDLILGTQSVGAEISHDDGASWAALNNAPHMNCLVESSAGELWACTQNYGTTGVPSDDAGIMKTTDLATWTKVLKFQELTDAVSCADGSIQQKTCVANWCAVCSQLGCTPSAAYACPTNMEAPVTAPAKGGCCDSGSGGAGALALSLAVGLVLLRPRRRSTGAGAAPAR